MKALVMYRSLLASIVAMVAVAPLFAADEPTPEPPAKGQVLYHESIPSLDFIPVTEAEAMVEESALAGTLSFDAFGEHFELALVPNDSLIADLPLDQQKRIKATHQVYKGHVAGAEGSWVRLTQSAGKWSGLVWDGITLYAIEAPAEVSQSLQSAPPDDAAAVIYRVSDLQTPGTCALDPNAQPLHSYPDLLNELNQLPPALPAATSRLNVAVVGDRDFVQNQSNPEGVATSLFNAVDGIYEDQVGVTININELRLLQNNDSLTSSSPSTLLNQVSNFSDSSAIDNPGLLHFLTGRNLNGNTIGIAYLGSLCSDRFGVGVSEIRNGSRASNIVLIAHEMGHNFRAPHDNQGGSACSGTSSGFIMNPSINGSSDTFSQCSLNQMQPEIDNAGCLVNNPNPPNPNPNPQFSADFNSGTDGFSFEGDTGSNARFTRGRRVSSQGVGGSGALRIHLGGINNATATDMEADWTTSFTGSGSVTLRLDARLVQAPHYEDNEFSEIGIVLDGQATVLDRLVGNGNGGPNEDTRFQSFSRNFNLEDGDHTLSLNCFNNRKTFRNEQTICLFDNVRIE